MARSRGDTPEGGFPSYITPEGHKKLTDEIDRLWNRERPRVTREVSEAAAQGDRSENAEYIYGKKRLREIDRRLRFLSKRIDNLEVVTTSIQDGRVRFGCWVEVENEDGEVSRYRLVGPDETEVDRGFISFESPVGRGLMGREEGDEVVVRRPKGELVLEILSVSYESASYEGQKS